MKKSILILFIVVLSFSFVSCSKQSEKDYIEKTIKVNLPENVTIESNNTQGGFLGDGTFFAKINFKNEDTQSFLTTIKKQKWSKLPLSNDLNLIMYGNELNGAEYAFRFADEVGMPKVENGYWCFNDRSDEKSVSLLERYSYNFTVAIFDTDNKILYVYTLDT